MKKGTYFSSFYYYVFIKLQNYSFCDQRGPTGLLILAYLLLICIWDKRGFVPVVLFLLISMAHPFLPFTGGYVSY